MSENCSPRFYISNRNYGGMLVSVSADTFEELEANLVALVGKLATEDILRQVQMDLLDNPDRPPAGVTPSGSGSASSRSQSQPRQADGPPPGQDVPRCQHGDMIRKTGGGPGTGKAAWGAHFCPEPVKANQCPPVWDKKG